MWPLETEPASQWLGWFTLRVFILEKCSETSASQATSQGLADIEGLGLYFPTRRTAGSLSYFSFPWETSTDSFSAIGTTSCWLQVSYRDVSPFLLKAEPRGSLLTETHSLRQGILEESKLGLGRGQSGKGRWVKFGYFQICNKASNYWVNMLSPILKRDPGWKYTLRSRVVGTWIEWKCGGWWSHSGRASQVEGEELNLKAGMAEEQRSPQFRREKKISRGWCHGI